MLEKGIITEINKGHGDKKLFNIVIQGGHGDVVYIEKFYEPKWGNLFKFKSIGRYELGISTSNKIGDIVNVIIDTKDIVGVEKIGTLAKTDLFIHELRGTGAIILSILFVMLVIITGQSQGWI